jgi:hypothetical protein
VPADGTGAAKCENGDFGKSRFWAGLVLDKFRFYGQLSDKDRLPCKPVKPASLRALITQWRVQRVAAE